MLGSFWAVLGFARFDHLSAIGVSLRVWALFVALGLLGALVDARHIRCITNINEDPDVIKAHVELRIATE